MPFHRFLAAFVLLCAFSVLSACGGGDSAGTGTASVVPLANSTITVSAAAGAQAPNNGAKTVGTVTATVTAASGSTFTNVVGTLEAGRGRLSLVYDTNTSAVTDVSLELGSPTDAAYLSGVCGPCAGVTVNTTTKSIAFVNTVVTDGNTPPAALATLNGTLSY